MHENELSNSVPPPLPAGQKRSNLVVTVTIVLACLGFVAVVVIGALKVGRFVREFRRGIAIAQQRHSPKSGVATGKKIEVAASTRTMKDFNAARRQFRVRQYVDAYREFGDHSAPWDKDATRLLEAWISEGFGGGPTNPPGATALADKLTARPDCKDPIILLAAASTSVERHENIKRLENAIAGFEKSKYRAYPRFCAELSLAEELSDTARVRALQQAAFAHFKQAFADGSFRPEDEEEIMELLSNEWANAFFGEYTQPIYNVVREAKGYDWLTSAVEGELEINKAWKARGTGYSDSVTAEGWRGFKEHLEKAEVALTKAWELRKDRPFPPTKMITVSMGNSDVEGLRLWFDRAIAAQIDYPQAWKSLRWALRPRWFGSHEAMLGLGFRAVETKRFDTEVPRQLFNSIVDIESEMEDLEPGEHIYGRADIWPHLSDMYEGYIAEPSQALSRDSWRSSYSAAAFLAGHYDTARAQLEALQWNPIQKNLTARGRDLSIMPLQVAALTGKCSAQSARAESAYEGQDTAEAIQLFNQLLASPDADERTRQFAKCRLAGLNEESRLAKGEWIEFLPRSDKDPNWQLAGEKLKFLPDGAVEVESGSLGHNFYSRTRVGPEFEVTGQFEVVRTSNGDYQGGLTFGLPDSLKSSWYAFRMKRNVTEGQLVSFSRGWSSKQAARQTPVINGTNVFQFRLQRDRADAWLNGVEVLRRASPSKNLNLSRNCLLGLGAYTDMNETVIRYRNIKVRRVFPGSDAISSLPTH